MWPKEENKKKLKKFAVPVKKKTERKEKATKTQTFI